VIGLEYDILVEIVSILWFSLELESGDNVDKEREGNIIGKNPLEFVSVVFLVLSVVD
jgi:hypothetical protein